MEFRNICVFFLLELDTECKILKHKMHFLLSEENSTNIVMDRNIHDENKYGVEQRKALVKNRKKQNYLRCCRNTGQYSGNRERESILKVQILLSPPCLSYVFYLEKTY